MNGRILSRGYCGHGLGLLLKEDCVGTDVCVSGRWGLGLSWGENEPFKLSVFFFHLSISVIFQYNVVDSISIFKCQ